MKFIVTGILGAIIGFFTNWLAIKMLFRPYKEKYFLGIKIPFTPGLIPKEQKRISINIGETVEDYLLSPESIVKFADEKNLEIKIKNSIEKYLIYLEEEKSTLKSILEKNTLAEYSNFRNVFVIEIKNLILKEAREKKHMKSLEYFLMTKLNDKELNKKIIKYLETEFRDFISDREFELLIQNQLEEKIKLILADDRKLNSILPENIKEKLSSYLDENQRIIGYKIRTLLTSPSMEKRLKVSISNMVEKNVSGIITTFVSVDTISDKIYYALKDYIKSDIAIRDMNLGIKSIINDLLDKKAYEIGEDLSNIIEKIEIDKYIVQLIRKELLNNNLFNELENRSLQMDKKPIVEILISNIENILNSDKFEEIIEYNLNKNIEKIEDIEIMDILDSLNIDKNGIYIILKKIFDNNIKDRLPQIIKSFNIGHIVESTINEFELDFVEKLIFDIADKELRAITLLGGVLGLLIGLLTPIIQML